MTLRIATLLASAALLLAAPVALADHHEGKGKAKAAEKAAEARGSDAAEEAREKGEEAAEAARGDEMRARRDERKAIMEETRSGAEPGTPRKGKKPWWRFWESDDEAGAE